MGSRVMLLVLVVVLVATVGECQRNRPGNRYGNRSRNQCPDPASFGRNCFTYQDQCRNSRQCSGAGQQCCLVAGCGRECVDVASTSPATEGRCPPASGLAGICVIGPNSCYEGKACPAGKLCCPEGCGSQCKDPL